MSPFTDKMDMQKSQIYILVVEDDPTLGKAIEESLKRSGYSVVLISNYAQALKTIELYDFMGAVIDCMLPGKNGVDLALELNKSSSLALVLTSGIYKDKAYATDAKNQTKAKAFLSKPFDIQQLINIFDECFQAKIDKTNDPLSQLLFSDKCSTRDKISAINSTVDIHGGDLPHVYSLLMDPTIQGMLSIQYGPGDEGQIYFNRGTIDSVNLKDTESYFGALLIEKGFITPDDLRQGLELKSKKPIGERLVEIASLSPHAIQVIQHEQMIIRISKTIREQSVSISFKESSKESSEIHIDGLLFTQLMNDWIFSKVNSDWLKSKYTPWMDCQVLQGQNFANLHLIKNLPVARHFANEILKSNWPQSLSEFIRMNPDLELEYIRGLHFCLVQRYVRLEYAAITVENQSGRMERLTRIWDKMQKQDHFQVLNVSPTARSSEISRSYHELAKSLHPDKLPADASPEVVDLCKRIFSRITEAYQILNDENKKENYLKTLELGHAEEILASEVVFDEGLRHLKSNKFREARRTFEKLIKMRGHRTDTIVYLTWALIKEKRNKNDLNTIAKKVDSLLEQVPHEDRHSAQYFFVKAMSYELNGDVQKAYNTFKRVLTIDPLFLDAKREITYIKSNYSKQKTSFMHDDLSTVVARFFKKKTG